MNRALPPVPLLDAPALLFGAYWADPILRKDFHVLVGCGAIQRTAQRDGRDCPSGWFFRAAASYVDSDEQGALALAAMTRIAMRFEEGRPE